MSQATPRCHVFPGFARQLDKRQLSFNSAVIREEITLVKLANLKKMERTKKSS